MATNGVTNPPILKALWLTILVLASLNVYQYVTEEPDLTISEIDDAETGRIRELADELGNQLAQTNTKLRELEESSERTGLELKTSTDSLLVAEEKIENLLAENEEVTIQYNELNQSLLKADEEISSLSRRDARRTYSLAVWRGGIAIPMEIEARSGTGLFIETDDVLLDESVQKSLKKAYYLAGIVARGGLDGREFRLKIRNPLIDTLTLNGESAGAAIAITMIALVLDMELNSSVLITGSIGSDGSVGEVGGIWNKAQAAKEANATVLLVPEGKKIDVDFIEIVEVSNITEVMEYMLEPR